MSSPGTPGPRPPRGRTDELLAEAIEAGQKAAAAPESLSARVAAFHVIELYKCLLDEVGSDGGLAIKESQNLPQKFWLARSAMPLLEKWATTIGLAEELRNMLSHTDYSQPDKARLEKLLADAPAIREDLRTEVARRNSGLTDAQLIDDSIAAMKSDLEQMGAAMSFYGHEEKWDQTHVEMLVEIGQLKSAVAQHDPPSLSKLLSVVRWCSERMSVMASEAISSAEADAQMMAGEAEMDRRRGYAPRGHYEEPDYEP